MTTRKIIARGDVQGVGFRYSTVKRAKEIGATGYVQNESDGSVVIVVSGQEREARLMEDWVRNNSPGDAREVEVLEYPEEHFADFEVRY